MTERHPLVQALAVDDRLPRAEIAAAIEHLPETAPDLLAVIEQAADGLLAEGDETTDNLFFFALHILAAAREPRLQAPLLRLLRRPQEEIDRLLGSVVSETLDNILVSAFDGRAEDLFALARDPATDEFVRANVFRSIAFLTWHGRIDAALTRAFVVQIDDDRALPEDEGSWFAWSEVIELLGWEDLAPRVEQAYADERIWRGLSSLQLFRRGLAEALAAAPDDASRFDSEGLGYITDAVTELEKYRFDPVPEPSPIREPVRLADASSSSALVDGARAGMPARNPLRHVGRNDPCPCGSGKKYKKCCLAA